MSYTSKHGQRDWMREADFFYPNHQAHKEPDDDCLWCDVYYNGPDNLSDEQLDALLLRIHILEMSGICTYENHK